MRSVVRFALVVALSMASCRNQTQPVTVPAGGGFTASCNGDFPSWISSNPPVADSGGDVNPHEPGIQKSFELAQSYPLGIAVLKGFQIDHFDPPQPDTDAPWRAFTDLTNATQRASYLDALKTYILAGMSDPGIDFDATRNNDNPNLKRLWFHVPMMTGTGTVRREPYHGATMERGLRANEQTHWLSAGPNLRAVAVGYYNFLGGYTIGQVFPSADITKTDPSKATFIDGTAVFKLLFAEYVPARITATPDPLLHAPSWWVQDPSAPTNGLTEMRLLQVDVAVKDDHFASTTGWVFATFVYDESLTTTVTNPWARLTPVGVMWGNDPTVTGNAVTTLNETWINPSMPAAFQFADHHGRAGRLIGPVDDPVSSCLSCHSTAEVDMAQLHVPAFMGASNKPLPTPGCNVMDWFRNLPSSASGATAFGHALSCPTNLSPTGLTSLDYSLQLQRGIGAVFGQNPNSNPCQGVALPTPAPAPPPPPPPPGRGTEGKEQFQFRVRRPSSVLVKIDPAKAAPIVSADPDPSTLR